MRNLMRTALATGAILAAFGAQAHAATTVGQTFTPPELCGSNSVVLATASPGNQYTVPSDGVLTSWLYQAPASPPQLKFKVARPAGGSAFTIVGESAPVTPSPDTLDTFAIRVPVHAGDILGLYAVTGGGCGQAVGGFDIHSVVGDQPPGSTTTYTFLAGHQLDVAAVLESDADGDGFGDETQDQCATDATTHGPCPAVVLPDTDPPETTITKHPPNKLARHKAKYKFVSDEAGSTFQCKVDKKPFKPCTSPKKVKHLDEGRHKFKVRAIDAAGNVDLTAAKDKFKVVG